MSEGLKDGKKPISLKPQRMDDSVFFNTTDFQGDMMAIPAAVKQELDELGYDYRWGNWSDIKRMGGITTRSGWAVYKSETFKTLGTSEWKYGLSPDGTLMRGADAVLVVKPKEMNAKHKEGLAKKASQQVRNFKKENRDMMSQQAKQFGLKVEEYDDED